MISVIAFPSSWMMPQPHQRQPQHPRTPAARAEAFVCADHILGWSWGNLGRRHRPWFKRRTLVFNTLPMMYGRPTQPQFSGRGIHPGAQRVVAQSFVNAGRCAGIWTQVRIPRQVIAFRIIPGEVDTRVTSPRNRLSGMCSPEVIFSTLGPLKKAKAVREAQLEGGDAAAVKPQILEPLCPATTSRASRRPGSRGATGWGPTAPSGGSAPRRPHVHVRQALVPHQD